MIRGVHQARDPGAIAQWFARSQKVSLIIITEFNDSHEHSPRLHQNSATTTLASNNDFGGASVTRLSFPSTPLLSTRYLSNPIQIGLTMTMRVTRTPIPPIFQEDASKPASGFPCHPRRTPPIREPHQTVYSRMNWLVSRSSGASVSPTAYQGQSVSRRATLCSTCRPRSWGSLAHENCVLFCA